MTEKKKLVFFTDLDNTMIYSYKRDIGEEKVEVEPYQGRIVSYMTQFSHRALQTLREEILFVPVSTRSVSQYQRIAFDAGWIPKYALVSNGGTLLVDGVADEEWKDASLQLIAPCADQLLAAEALLQEDTNRTLEVRRVDGLFVFTKSSQPERTLERLAASLDLEEVELYRNGVKVYVLPKALNKGAAVDRFLGWIGGKAGHTILCAGDSDFDLPLLERGDVIFCPADLAETGVLRGKGEIHAVAEGNILSDEIFAWVKKRI